MKQQQPLGTGYGAITTAAEVIAGIDLSGMNVIITGGYAGIGLETVRVLSAAGAEMWAPAGVWREGLCVAPGSGEWYRPGP
jgi:hypothetical protein